jgi:hypothetical protein
MSAGSGPTSLSSYSAQINTTHAHTSGGWSSYCLGNVTQGGITRFSTGYHIPRPPPSVFDSTHQSPRTRSDLLPSNTFRLKRVDPTQSLSQNKRSPAANFVSNTTPKPIQYAADANIGPGSYNTTHRAEHDRRTGVGGRTFNLAPKATGKRWESITGDLPGPGAYGIPEILKQRAASPRFCSDQALERPEMQSCPGPGRYKIHQKARDMTSVKYSSVGFFGLAPRFSSRSERMRLQAQRPSTPSKNWEAANMQEATTMTSKKRTAMIRKKGRKLQQKLKRVKQKRIEILEAEDKRCSEIMARPEALRKRRWVRTMTAHLCNAARVSIFVQHLVDQRNAKEKENERIAHLYWFQRFWKYWRKVHRGERLKKHICVFWCSSKLVGRLHRLRYRRQQSDILRRHLYATIAKGNVLIQIRQYRQNAVVLQRFIRRHFMRDACHLLIMRQQLIVKWKAVTKSQDKKTSKSSYDNDTTVKEKKTTKKTKKRKKEKKHKKIILIQSEPTEEELETLLLGVAKSQLKKWREEESKTNTRTRWGLFTEEEMELLLFEARELWKHIRKVVHIHV